MPGPEFSFSGTVYDQVKKLNTKIESFEILSMGFLVHLCANTWVHPRRWVQSNFFFFGKRVNSYLGHRSIMLNGLMF